MHKDRLITLNQGKKIGNKKYVLYFMQQSQRVHYNHALNHAIYIANLYDLEVLVCFFIDDTFYGANQRHFKFMLEGMSEVSQTLKHFKIGFYHEIGFASELIKPLLKDAFYVVFDHGYMRYQKQIRKSIYEYIIDEHIDLPLVQIDSDMVMPIRAISNKAEYGAYAIRPKIMKQYQSYLDFKRIDEVNKPFMTQGANYPLKFDVEAIMGQLNVDRSVSFSPVYQGGYIAAQKQWFKFVSQGIDNYLVSNDPSTDYTSKMSLYLHFGQISVLELIDKLDMYLSQASISKEAYDAYIEQLVVRRTLAFNYVNFNLDYDSFDHMTENWAYETMKVHQTDEREYLYDQETIEFGLTHDIYFNAAMAQMRITGYMHNYMRMYWAKKIIEWTIDYQTAYKITIDLNNKYFIDGRDPNSYAGVAWCFGKHDRAWTERPIFGKLRYMNAKGLERKFKMKDYVEQMNVLIDTYEKN